MNMTTWSRDNGWVSVNLFKNGETAAVSTKHYATQEGAKAANEKIRKMCGDNYQHMNFPWSTTNIKTGEVTVHYRSENLKPL